MVLSVSQLQLRILKQMLYWNECTKSLERCYAQLKLIWSNQLPPVMLMSFLTLWHGQFALPYIQYLRSHCDNIHSWISLSGDLVFSHLQGIYGFKFPKRFLEVSSRDLTLFLLQLI
jgi:hypothetical protein